MTKSSAIFYEKQNHRRAKRADGFEIGNILLSKLSINSSEVSIK